MNVVVEKFAALSRRERIVVAAGAGAVALILLYNFVWQPWQRELDRLRSAVPEKAETLAWMRAQAPRIETLKSRQSGGGEQAGLPLLTLLERSATRAEIREDITRMSPGDEPDQVRVWMDNADFDRWLRWLESLKDNGIEVAEASIDRTGESRVNIRTTLQR